MHNNGHVQFHQSLDDIKLPIHPKCQNTRHLQCTLEYYDQILNLTLLEKIFSMIDKSYHQLKLHHIVATPSHSILP